MPGLIFHQCLTKQALESNRIFDADELVKSYCAYPDFYYDERSPEVKPYMYFHDGIQFHYPPHTPVEEFYRYWDRNEDGNYPFNHHQNENIIHVESGFRFYLGKIIPLLKSAPRLRNIQCESISSKNHFSVKEMVESTQNILNI